MVEVGEDVLADEVGSFVGGKEELERPHMRAWQA